MRSHLAAVRAVHPFPSLLVAALTVAIVPLADPDARAGRYAVLGLGMLLFQFAIGLTNDIVDIEDDRVAKPWKPLVRGDLSPLVARRLAAGFAVVGLLLTLTLPPIAWAIGALGLASGLAYDLRLKRTDFSWLPYSIALPLVPIWVHTATEAWRASLWWAVPLGAILGLALHLANQAPDLVGGEHEGLPGRLGPRASGRVAVGLFAGVAGVVALLAVPSSPPLAVLPAGLAAAVVAASPSAQTFGRDGLFGLLASGSAVLAVLYFWVSA